MYRSILWHATTDYFIHHTNNSNRLVYEKFFIASKDFFQIQDEQEKGGKDQG